MKPEDIKPLPAFTNRELQLIANCVAYSNGIPAGLPGHNLMLIIGKFVRLARAREIELPLEQDEGAP